MEGIEIFQVRFNILPMAIWQQLWVKFAQPAKDVQAFCQDMVPNIQGRDLQPVS